MLNNKERARYERTGTNAVLVISVFVVLTVVAVVGLAVHEAFTALTDQLGHLKDSTQR